ncbi:MAG TPA: acyltransferase [Candidatus Hydrogenedens sp.]|nr:acyltransferase [Candidatus Hydrogenedens sp.]
MAISDGKTIVGRRNDIEYLRIIAVLLLIPFHCAMVFFSYEPFYVKSTHSHLLLDYFVFLLSPWYMPLLFIIAGMASCYSLKKRTWKQYFIERTKRLLIPFLFGIFFIVPPQPFIAYIRNYPDNSLIDFLKQYFFHIQGDFTGYTGSFTPAHLWFILYLYIFSIISIPLFLLIKKHSEIIVLYLSKQGLLLLYPIIIGLAEQLPSISSKNPFYYYTYFLIGYLIASQPQIEQSVNKEKAFALLLGLLTMTTYLSLIKSSFNFEKYSYSDISFYILRKFNAWFWLIWILGYGKNFLNFKSKILPYTSKMSYPFYIIHQTVIILLAYYIVQWQINIWVQFFSMVILSYILTIAIYHFLVRKNKLLQLLLGIVNQ